MTVDRQSPSRKRPESGRSRSDNTLRFLLVALLAVVAWRIAPTFEARHASAAEGPDSTAAVPAPPKPPLPEPVTRVVRRGDTFAGVLSHCGVTEPAATRYYRHFRDLGLAAVFPGDSIVVRHDRDGRLRGVALLNRLLWWYRIRRDSCMLYASRTGVRTAVYRQCAKGVLRASLSEDMYGIGEGDGLVGKLEEIFAWDINFFTDPRVGDRFEVLFEKRYAEGRAVGYGEVLAARYRTATNEFWAIGLAGSDGRMQYYDRGGKSVQKQFLKAPLRYSRISSGYAYSRRHPILKIHRPHLGVDYAAPRGTPVHAAADGVVTHAGWKGDYGITVCIAHGAAYTTYYGHLQSIAGGVAEGARVKQGQRIGTVGATGLATGPHLDYRMRVGQRFVNPATVVVPALDSVSAEQRGEFERTRDVCLLVLEGRFVREEGSWVVEIDSPPPEHSTAVVRLEGEGHVASSGS